MFKRVLYDFVANVYLALISLHYQCYTATYFLIFIIQVLISHDFFLFYAKAEFYSGVTVLDGALQ